LTFLDLLVLLAYGCLHTQLERCSMIHFALQDNFGSRFIFTITLATRIHSLQSVFAMFLANTLKGSARTGHDRFLAKDLHACEATLQLAKARILLR
jgi:hypothetical protein